MDLAQLTRLALTGRDREPADLRGGGILGKRGDAGAGSRAAAAAAEARR